MLTFSLSPDFLGLNLEKLKDGMFEFDGDHISFNSRIAEAEEVKYYETVSTSKHPYQQIIITDIKRK